ncbi:MAG TPA: hypothetical protein VMQ60_02280 [Acidobacteriaceae bacterium]|jgi:hypothetical protein|nr:hypothetical protein [Acidobacteriaceae bacterium]
MRIATAAFLASLLLAGKAFGQAEEKEPVAIVEIGAAGEWALTHGKPSYGPDFAVEVTPIPEWLEIEAGVSPLFSRGQAEWDSDLLFKKPYTLSKTLEFMCGVGPEWAHTISGGTSSNSVAGEAALDFMFWPQPKRRFGWYLEPSYGYSFSSGHEQSFSVSAGLLIAIP